MIAVLGAGLAGLSAADKLIELGHRNVTIIEAKDEPGGRVKSKYYPDGSRIDFGAQWLHGERQNPIYNWLDNLGLIKGLEEDEVEFEGSFRTNTGVSPPEDVINLVLEFLMDAKQVLLKMSDLIRPSSRPVDMYRKFLKIASEKNSLLRNADPSLIQAVLRWFELYETIDNSCEDLSLLSMKAYSSWNNYDDGKMVCLNGGWQAVVNKLIERIGASRIIYNSPVNRITYSSEGVCVEHAKGSLKCKHVIITFSVGVLKNLDRTFFEPPLSDERRLSIKKIGFGSINKIFLQFDRPYLHDTKGLKLLWMNDKADESSRRTHTASSSELDLPGWARYLTGFDLVEDAPNFLLAWVGGEGARMVENHTPDEIGQGCLNILRKFLPPEDHPPQLVSVKHTTWAADTHFLGSYSYESIESLEIDKNNLWAPIFSEEHDQTAPESTRGLDSDRVRKLTPRVLFAGEATSGPMYSTAHGAIVSGWREATRLDEYAKMIDNTNP